MSVTSGLKSVTYFRKDIGWGLRHKFQSQLFEHGKLCQVSFVSEHRGGQECERLLVTCGREVLDTLTTVSFLRIIVVMIVKKMSF